MKKTFLLMAAAAFLAVVSCDEKNEAPKPQPTFDAEEVTLTKPAYAGEDYEVAIEASDDLTWTVAMDDTITWLELETQTGTGKGKVVFSLEENTDTQSRTATLVVTATDGSSFNAEKKINVTQLGTDPVLAISPSGTVSLPYQSAQEYKVTVTSNLAWQAALEDVEDSWLTIVSQSVESGEIVLSLTENEGQEARTGKLVVTSADNASMTAILNIEQQFRGIVYTIRISGMKDYVPEGAGSMEFKTAAGTVDAREVEVALEEEVSGEGESAVTTYSTVISYPENIPAGDYTIVKLTVDAQEYQFNAGLKLDEGGMAQVETWHNEFNLFGGDSKDKPLLVNSVEFLTKLQASVAEGKSFEGIYFRQEQDITMPEESWAGIGAENKPFSGKYDGNNKTIKGLKIDTEEQKHGFFNVVYGTSEAVAEISNLTIEGSVNGTNGYVAAFVAVVGGNTHIKNCVNKADITACSAFTVKGGANTAGLFGSAAGTNIIIEDCVNFGKLNTSNHTVFANNCGGIVGSANGSTEETDAEKKRLVIRGCSNEGELIVRGNSGGVVGSIGDLVDVYRCSNYGTITSTGTTNQTGNDRTGGVVGNLGGTAVVKECFNKGKVSGAVNKGGIVGYLDGSAKVKDCYNSGELCVIGNNANNGGIVGHKPASTSEISCCYNSGKFSPTDDKTKSGAIVGTNSAAEVVNKEAGNIVNCYYEADKGFVMGVAKCTDAPDYSTALTAAQMTSGSAFNGWSADVWKFESGKYPTLKNNPEK